MSIVISLVEMGSRAGGLDLSPLLTRRAKGSYTEASGPQLGDPQKLPSVWFKSRGDKAACMKLQFVMLLTSHRQILRTFLDKWCSHTLGPS